MCGIGGILRTDGEPIPDQWLDAIDSRVAYRGPDGHGRFRDRVVTSTPDGERAVEVAFVHRRLSIIDHDSGEQPMVSPRGRSAAEGLVAVVFNGCIYNHRELRAELQGAGHRFVSDHSDTEVLIHGHREWGERLPDHLEGMYAYAIWDRTRLWLMLARDQFGEKPLYCRASIGEDDDLHGHVVFASDAAAVASVPGDGDGDMRRFAAEYLQLGYAWRGRTIHAPTRGVVNLRTRTCLGLRPSGGVLGFEGASAGDDDPPGEAATIEDCLEQAVARRLEADVPLGCFLSGGIDSSLIAHFAKKHKDDLRTFCVRMPDPRYDESPHAALVAEHLGTDHTTLDVSTNPIQDIVRLVGALGQPFGDSSLLPTFWVSKAARQHVKVALSGDGGDELFIGYERYLGAAALHKAHRVLAPMPTATLLRAHPRSRTHKLGRLIDMARDYRRLGVLSMESIFTQRQITALLDGRPEDPPAHHVEDDEALQSLRRIDLCSYLPDDLLCKVDTASMAVALEVRCPFLDRDLSRAALATPVWQLIPGRRRKGLLRKIAAKHLPAEIIRRPKTGFAIPISDWFRTDHGGLKTMLLDHMRSIRPFGPIELNRRAVRRIIDEHMTRNRDHGQRLFALLTLAVWARTR